VGRAVEKTKPNQACKRGEDGGRKTCARALYKDTARQHTVESRARPKHEQQERSTGHRRTDQQD